MAAFFGSIIVILLFITLFILVLGINLIARLVGGLRNLWNIIMGKGFASNTRSQRRQNTTYTYNTQSQGQYGAAEDQGHRPHSKGVFGDDEGTYVDFEEIKE